MYPSLIFELRREKPPERKPAYCICEQQKCISNAQSDQCFCCLLLAKIRGF